MTDRPLPNDDRLLDLLTAQATEGLDAEQAAELDAALHQLDDEAIDIEGLDRTAAAIELGAIESADDLEAMPEALATTLISQGEHLVGDRTAATPASPPGGPGVAPATDHGGWKLFSAAGLGWLAAAAAIVVAVVTVFVSGPAGSPDTGQPDPAVARANLLQTADDLVTVEWATKTPEFANVRGDVVWSDTRQTGYMRFTGMPVNDPTRQQYQLWIVDPDRDAKPVDGGVFDVNEDGEVIIPINAKLPVDDPELFAITVEKPGGVVVSEGPLHIVAPVSG